MRDSFGIFSCSHAPKAPSACQAMDGAGRFFQFDEVDGSLVPPPQVGDGNAVSRHGCVYYSVIKTYLTLGVS